MRRDYKPFRTLSPCSLAGYRKVVEVCDAVRFRPETCPPSLRERCILGIEYVFFIEENAEIGALENDSQPAPDVSCNLVHNAVRA